MKNLGLYKDNLDIPRKQDVDAVASRVSTNEDNIVMLDSDMETAQSDISTLKTNVTEVTQALTSKQDTIVGGASTVVDDNLVVNRTLVSNSSGKIATSEVTSTELGFLSGVKSNIQEQLDGKAVPDNLVRYYDVAPTQAVDKVNADTLEGHTASYFATASALSDTNAQVSALNSNLSATNAQVSALNSNLSATNAQVSTANEDISALQSAMGDKVDKSGGAMTGKLVAQNNTDYTVAQIRNVIISTADPSGGNNGDIWIKYTP